MKFAVPLLINALIVAALAGLSLYVIRAAPDGLIATHFDLHGKADGWMPRDQAAWFMPIMAGGIAVTFAVLPLIMPKKGDLGRSAEAYGVASIGIVAILALAHATLMARALGYDVDPVRPILAGTGLLLATLGNYLPKTRYNYVMGVRTPWTLADERVWDQTHRLAGPLMMLGGLAVTAGVWFVPLEQVIWLLLAGAAAPSLIAVVYSYIVAKRLGGA
ncbi:MAG: SdpI family protein [Pseudomonadota bacterium]|jgi:uncharacterized membrane protein